MNLTPELNCPICNTVITFNGDIGLCLTCQKRVAIKIENDEYRNKKNLSFTMEMNVLIQRYLMDAKSEYLNLSEIDSRPHHKKVWTHWRAKAYLKIDNYFERLEDVPEGLQQYTIMTKDLHTQYLMLGGSQAIQVMDLATCKKIYG